MIEFVLIIHILAGSMALFTGPLAIAFKHGGNLHRIFGKIFFYAMLVVSLTATIVGIAHKNYFLFIVAVFSAYLVSSGYRVLYLKKLNKDQKPKALDYFITGTMFIFSLFFIAWGAFLAINKSSFSIVFLTFGAISFWLALRDKMMYEAKNLEKNFWLFSHIVKMIAGNIAAFTAFLVVNIQMKPGFILWVAPSLIGGFVIRYYLTFYRKKLSKGSKVQQIVDIKIEA